MFLTTTKGIRSRYYAIRTRQRSLYRVKVNGQASSFRIRLVTYSLGIAKPSIITISLLDTSVATTNTYRATKGNRETPLR